MATSGYADIVTITGAIFLFWLRGIEHMEENSVGEEENFAYLFSHCILCVDIGYILFFNVS